MDPGEISSVPGSIGDIVKKLFRTYLDRRCFDAYTRRKTVELEI